MTVPVRAADAAWAALIGGIIGYELLSPPGELLSEGADRYPRWLVWPVVAATAAHLVRALPSEYDPYHPHIWRRMARARNRIR
jgi:hypothetical protein